MNEQSSRGFRPTARRRNRIAAGVALGAVAIGGNVLVYASLDGSEPVVQVIRDVPAGSMITADMLRTVDVDAGPTVNVVDGADLATLIGRYNKVRLVSGSLITREALQSAPLVSDGNAVVAIQVTDGELPNGLRERAPVRLVIPADRNDVEPRPIVIDGRVVGLPTASNNALGTLSLSVELERDDASTVAAADRVRVVLLTPTEDPAAMVNADGAVGDLPAESGTG